MSEVLNPALLSNKTAWITGGGTGLGRAMALRFAKLGAAVAVCGRREEPLAATVDVTAGAPITSDVALAKVVDELGGLDILVNNAAGNFLCPAEELSPNGFAAVVGIVLHGTFHCTRAAGRYWIENKRPGAVLSIATTYAWTGSAFVLPSACAKAGGRRAHPVSGGRVGASRYPAQRDRPRSDPDRGCVLASASHTRARGGPQEEDPRGTIRDAGGACRARRVSRLRRLGMDARRDRDVRRRRVVAGRGRVQ